MTYFATPPMYFPDMNLWPSTVGHLNLAVANRVVVAYFQAPKDGDIDSIKVGVSDVNAANLTVRIETWDSGTNQATGTLVNAGATSTVAVGASDDDTYVEMVLSTPATVTQGTVYCAVFSCNITTTFRIARATGRFTGTPYTPYSAYADSGSYTTQNWVVSLVLNYDGDSGYIRPPGYHSGIYQVNRSFDATDSPDEYGIKFDYPVGMRASGMYFWADGDPVTFHLYDSGDTDLLNQAEDSNYRKASSFGNTIVWFENDIDIAADEVHRFTAEATGATLMIRPWRFESSMAGHSGTFTGTGRTNGGSWTDDDSYLLAMGLIVTAVDVPSGGGGAFAYGFGG